MCRKNEDDVTSHDGRTIENGMTFRIENVGRRDISCVSLADGSRWEIPREFLETGCEAGYACTVHRCQGMTVDRCAVLFPSDANTPCNLQYVAGSRGKEENHFYYACPDEEQRKIRHQLSGVETDPKAIAMSRMKASLLNHPDAATATETLERERTDRMNLKRLMREHDYAAGLISGPHLNAMLARRHDPKTVDKITRSPSYEWLRGVWSRAYMTDAKRALAIIGQPLDPDRLKGRRLDRDQLVGKIARIARVLHPDRMDDTTYRIDMDVSRDSEQARYVTEILERSDIPYALADTLDGKAITIDVDHSCIPAVKTILDGLCQTVKGFDQSLFPQWRELRREEGRILKENPGMRRQSRPVEPDWAATIAGRLNAGLLDRVNGTVHEEWCAGVIPRIRASRHGSELDIVRQNERLIELKVGELVRDAQASNQPWTGRILEASADDPTLFRDVVVYRAMWQVDEEDDPLGERPPTSSGRQEQH
ncbi:TrwC relaxase [Bifidobacterium mongoliense]|uniref:TrwC relaxase n=1 Tax=Bifidobacterium mongoliense TaxID=518643 RepID=A0A423UBT0_9BIFI|nr:TrwC relaxase [Bifidobacterium mongoliense]